MLFGRSLFQSVVERLQAEREEEGEADADNASYRIRGLNSGFVVDAADIGATNAAQLRDAYLSLMPEETDPWSPAETEGPAPMPEHLARLSVDEIAADLALSDRDTHATLAEKRRAFALLNHPDRIAAMFGDNATTRMKIANLLIDEAQRRLRPHTIDQS